ncbi:MAG TPA: amidohydrolase family protein, partial [Candidatus Hydrogenedentes bacterium]|nr:amidohydrolase family protein [Candidatus Hydrogenedentota bacterium]
YRLRVMAIDTTDAVDFEWREDILYRRPPSTEIVDEEAYTVEAVLLDDDDIAFPLKTFADAAGAHAWLAERELELAEMTKSKVHVCHVSSAGSVEIVRRAKARGIRVTCETAPHYWTLTDDAVTTFNTNAKMNPPLREEEDVAAIKTGIKDGTIDCIATDHAPHTPTEKDVEFDYAPFGIVGLETSLGLVITELVEPGILTLERAIEMMTNAPARILDLPAGTLGAGKPADIAIFDPKAEYTVDPATFLSRSRNTPFAGRRLRGLVKATLCDGRFVYREP